MIASRLSSTYTIIAGFYTKKSLQGEAVKEKMCLLPFKVSFNDFIKGEENKLPGND